MTTFNMNGRKYMALTLRADTALKRCKDLAHLSFMGGVNRDDEISAILADIAEDCIIM